MKAITIDKKTDLVKFEYKSAFFTLSFSLHYLI